MKNFLHLYPNSAAVICVSWLFSFNLVNTFYKVPVTKLYTLTSLDVNRNIEFVVEQTLKSNIEWNSFISFDFFYKEGARNWVIFF